MQPQQTFFGRGFALLVALILIPFAIATIYALPNGDDFAAAVKARHLFDLIGGIDTMFSAWWKWSGRYSYHFLQIFFGDLAEYKPLYSLFLLCSFGLFWLSAFGIARELGKDHDQGQAAFCATVWLAAMLCTHGFLGGWYLLVELLTLTGGHCLTLLYIWSLCRLWNRPVLTRGTKWFCILSAVVAAGMYEYSAMMVLMVSFTAWVMARIYGHVHTRTYFLLLLVAGGCFLFSYLARGNFRRQTKRNVTTALMLEQLAQVGTGWVRHVLPHLLNPVFLVAALLAGWFTPGWKIPLTAKIPASLILLAGAAATCAFTLSLTIVLALSDVTIDESPKLPTQMAQYSTVFVMFCLLACRDALHLGAIRRLGRPLGLALLFALLLGGNSNFFPVLWHTLSGTYTRYAAANDKRAAVLAEHANRAATVMPLAGAPFPFLEDLIAPHAKSWPNKYAGPFYGVLSLEAVAAEPYDALWEARARGLVTWAPAGNGNAACFVPALALPPNATYTCDWIFITSAGSQAPSLRLLALPGSLATLPETIRAQAFAGTWPFAGLVQSVPLVPVAGGGGRTYAAHLPFNQGALDGKRIVVVSVNGGEFLPLAGFFSRGR